MQLKVFYGLLVMAFVREALSISTSKSPRRSKVLERRKRYVVFPEGSSFSMAICSQIAAIGTPADNVILYALNWALAFDLPNETRSETERREREFETKSVKQRRHRRGLYSKMEIVMDTMGYSGRACINRAICETSWKLRENGGSLVSELIRTIFRQPRNKVYSFEPLEHKEHDTAYWNGISDSDCDSKYPNCGFSLIDLVL